MIFADLSKYGMCENQFKAPSEIWKGQPKIN